MSFIIVWFRTITNSSQETFYMPRYLSLSPLMPVILSAALIGIGCGMGAKPTTNEGSKPAANASTPASTPAPTASPAAAKVNIAGEYDATGTNPDGGAPYKAGLVVTPRDDVYQFSWLSGSSKYDGVGVMTDNTVAVSYTSGSDGKGCGVVLYKIGADGTLDGVSGYWGNNVAEKEKAVRDRGTDLEGRYEISGTNTGGKSYKGELNIKKDGEGYVFEWNAGSLLTGYGIRTGDKVAVGFGGKQCTFVAYDVKPDGTLDGKWGGQSARSFGTEIAKKK